MISPKRTIRSCSKVEKRGAGFNRHAHGPQVLSLRSHGPTAANPGDPGGRDLFVRVRRLERERPSRPRAHGPSRSFGGVGPHRSAPSGTSRAEQQRMDAALLAFDPGRVAAGGRGADPPRAARSPEAPAPRPTRLL